MNHNIDNKVVEEFGNEWSEYNQSELSEQELNSIFFEYFEIFPWKKINKNSKGFDLGCGSGRWAKCVAPRVGHLHCIDPSDAINVAEKNLQNFDNCTFHHKGVDELPFEDNSMDFGYSLGVLHHIPDTLDGMKKCVAKLKKGAPFLVYLYYAFDNQPFWYRLIWKVSDFFRRIISKFPFKLKLIITNIIALLIYLPLGTLSKFLKKIGFKIHSFPLSNYYNKSFYTMRTDALDRFGTQLELRYTKHEIIDMMEKSGLKDIIFSTSNPFWCAVGIKK
jgi:ubiquinone/menaquinone biosynthesis C-methylase UbiE